MSPTLIVLLVVAAVVATAFGLWRLLRRQIPHPVQDRRTIDFDELRAMWPSDNGSPE